MHRHTIYACTPPSKSSRPVTRPRIAIISKNPGSIIKKEMTIDVSELRKGLFGMRANAYWDSIGVLPLFFAGFGLVALTIKMLKVKGGEIRGGASGINKMIVPKTVITSEKEQAELHVFKCGGCGYEMYPARGREFKFFPDSFKCPLCATPKSEFWDLNDPDDPRNETKDEEEEDDDDESSSDSPDPDPVAPTAGNSTQPAAEDATDRLRKDNSDSQSSS